MNVLGENPIFVVGCTNSGTTVLHDCIMSHPDVDGVGVEPHYGGLAPNMNGRLNRLFALWPCWTGTHATENSLQNNESGVIGPPQVKQWVQCYYNHFEKERAMPFDLSKRQLIKEPKFSLRIRWLKKIWPESHIVAIVRNPWAVVEGVQRKLSAFGDLPLKVDTPTALAQWQNVNSTIMLESAGLRKFTLVRYEDLIAADEFPSTNISKNQFWQSLFGHLNLDPKKISIPNETQNTHFDSSRNEFSLSRLSSWDIDFIEYTASHLINVFNYDTFLEEMCRNHNDKTNAKKATMDA